MDKYWVMVCLDLERGDPGLRGYALSIESLHFTTDQNMAPKFSKEEALEIASHFRNQCLPWKVCIVLIEPK